MLDLEAAGSAEGSIRVASNNGRTVGGGDLDHTPSSCSGVVNHLLDVERWLLLHGLNYLCLLDKLLLHMLRDFQGQRLVSNLDPFEDVLLKAIGQLLPNGPHTRTKQRPDGDAVELSRDDISLSQFV